jgi:hypothetical protein
LPQFPRQRQRDYYLVRRFRSLIRRVVNNAALCAALATTISTNR